MKKRSSRFSRNRAILLGALLLAVGTLLICLCRVAMRSSQAALQKGLAGMEGCSVREVREAGPEKLGLRGIRVFGRDGSLFAIGSGSVDFRRLDSGRPPELVSIALQDFEIRRLDGFLEQLVLSDLVRGLDALTADDGTQPRAGEGNLRARIFAL